ncbi:hypothetical protein [Micromonospora sp. NPDC049240]|uniref:hypothetical protein n=1 Tax=Micromonospora sp. NPDC049240 TaxID=3155151 RepID=UPI0033DDE691
MRRLAVLGAAMLALAGCGSDVTSGTVVAKDHVAARDWTYWQPIYVARCDSKGVCTMQQTGVIPVEMHDPECWRLALRAGNDTGEVCVDQQTWERTAPNDHYEPAKGVAGS